MERDDAKRPLPLAAPHEVKETGEVRKSGIALFLSERYLSRGGVALLELFGAFPGRPSPRRERVRS